MLWYEDNNIIKILSMEYDQYEKVIMEVIQNYEDHKDKGKQSRALYKKAQGEI